MTWQRITGPAEHLSEEEAQRILAESPDLTLLVDYLCGEMNADDAAALQRRLAEDVEFRAFAEPRIRAWNAVPVAQRTLTPDELAAHWKTFQEQVGLRPADPMDEVKVRRRIELRLRVLIFGLTFVLLMGLPIAFLKGRGFGLEEAAARNRVVPTPKGVTSVPLGGGSSLILEVGSQFRQATPTGQDVELVLLSGRGIFTLEKLASGLYVIVTPHGRLALPEGSLDVDARNPAATYLRVASGRVEASTEGQTTRLILGPGDVARLQQGQPPNALVTANAPQPAKP